MISFVTNYYARKIGPLEIDNKWVANEKRAMRLFDHNLERREGEEDNFLLLMNPFLLNALNMHKTYYN